MRCSFERNEFCFERKGFYFERNEVFLGKCVFLVWKWGFGVWSYGVGVWSCALSSAGDWVLGNLIFRRVPKLRKGNTEGERRHRRITLLQKNKIR